MSEEQIMKSGDPRIVDNLKPWHEEVLVLCHNRASSAGDVLDASIAPMTFAYLDQQTVQSFLRKGVSVKKMDGESGNMRPLTALSADRDFLFYTSYDVAKDPADTSIHLFEVLVRLDNDGVVTDYSAKWLEGNEMRVSLEGVVDDWPIDMEPGVWSIGAMFSEPLGEEAHNRMLPFKSKYVRAVVDIAFHAEDPELEYDNEDSFVFTNVHSIEEVNM